MTENEQPERQNPEEAGPSAVPPAVPPPGGPLPPQSGPSRDGGPGEGPYPGQNPYPSPGPYGPNTGPDPYAGHGPNWPPASPAQPGQPGYPGLPGQPSMFQLTQRERQLAMWCHLGPLLAGAAMAVLGSVLYPLGLMVAFVWVIPLVIREGQGRRSAYVRWHATESLNFQLTVLGAMIVGFVLIFVLVGLLVLAAVGIVSLILLIIASIKANEGTWYRYPISIRFVK